MDSQYFEFEVNMIYIQIAERYDAKGFLLLAKSGTPVQCYPGNKYGVQPVHVALLKRKGIRFKKLSAHSIPLPKASLAA